MDRPSLSSKKKNELLKICQDNKTLYKGYSKYKKKEELIDFILSKGSPADEQFQESELDIGEDLVNLFQEQDESINRMFRARPLREKIDKIILDVEEHIKKNDLENSVIFDIYDNNENNLTYRLFKHKFYKKYGNLGKHGEMILFHGTDEENIQGILENDFSLIVNPSHGHRHGRGIYFTNCIDKAMYYSERSSNEKFVIVSLVHVGDIMVGHMSTNLHPQMPDSTVGKTYDTSVDSLYGPKQFVKKVNGSYNILGVMKITNKTNINHNPRRSQYLTGGATGQSNEPELKIGTRVEIITKRLMVSPITGNKESFYQKKAVIDSNRFTSGGHMRNLYRIVLDESLAPGGPSRSQRTLTISESLIKQVDNTNTQNAKKPLECRLRVTNATDDVIKLYWIPNHINIYDPTLDIRQHGKFMGNINQGYTSAFKTNKGDNFMCSNNIGYIRMIVINNKYEDVVIPCIR